MKNKIRLFMSLFLFCSFMLSFISICHTEQVKASALTWRKQHSYLCMKVFGNYVWKIEMSIQRLKKISLIINLDNDLKAIQKLELIIQIEANYKNQSQLQKLDLIIIQIIRDPSSSNRNHKQNFQVLITISPKSINKQFMSHLNQGSILTYEFHMLAQQNSRLNQNLISITLTHQSLLEENKNLSESLKKKDFALIESTLRQKNLDHTLTNVRKEYSRLQNDYKELFDWMNADSKLQMRDMYKKQSQLSMDLAFIQRQSYKECKKSKNQQLQLYQHRIIALAKQNETLKCQILQMTSQYNAKIYELKSQSLENSIKLKNLQRIEQRRNQKSNQESYVQNTGNYSRISTLQLEVKLQNVKQHLELYIKQNQEIKKRNRDLWRQFQGLCQQKKKLNVQNQNLTAQSHLSDKLKQQNCSMQYITSTFQQNNRLRRQIEQITNKYTLLSETYPQLIQNADTITQLESNIKKLQNLKQIQNELLQSKLKTQSLKDSLKNLQKQYLAELKVRENVEFKLNVLVKRFNEMFIRMNPFFDIYQYEGLDLDENMTKFFDQSKDYKQLKQYESKILQIRRENQENEFKHQTKQRQLNLELQERQREILNLKATTKQLQDEVRGLTEVNILLKAQIKQSNSSQLQQIYEGQEMTQQNQERIQIIKAKKLQTQVTIPLLERLVNNLQQQREQLLLAINNKDNQLVQLSQQVKSLTLNQPIKTILIPVHPQARPNVISSSCYDFSELIKQNQKLQAKYDSTAEQFRVQIQKMQSKINNQHDLYQMEVKKYEREYELKLSEITNFADKWVQNYDKLKAIIQGQQDKKALQKQNKQAEIQAQQNANQQRGAQRSIMLDQNRNQEEINQNDNLFVRQPSLSNLERIPTLNQQSGNKLIGQSTVHNLTATLKKYQHDMNQVLIMCAKLSEEYSELKKKLKTQQDLENQIGMLKQKYSAFASQYKEVSYHLAENRKTLASIQAMYKAKSDHCQQLKSLVNTEKKSMELQYETEKRKNEQLNKQLLEIKQKLYQVAIKPQNQSEQGSINRGQFQTIVVMHANKNKQLTHLSQKNKSLETRVDNLMQQLNNMKQKSLEKRSNEISPLERAQMKQLSSLLHETNIIQLVRRANQIVEQQSQKQRIEEEGNEEAKE